MLGSWARARHEGRAGDGFPNSEHQIDAGWVQWNLAAQFGIVERFGVDVMLPLRLTTLRVGATGPGNRSLDISDTIHRDQSMFSAGDMLLSTRWGLVRNEDVRGWTLDARLGASVPTGRIRRDPFHPDNEDGVERLSHGSGTVDPWFGLESFYNAGRWGLTTFGSAKLPVATNRFGNRAARVFQAGAGVATGFGLVKWRFLAQPEVFVASPVRWRDQDAPSTGRVSLIASAGVFVQPKPRLGVHAKVSVPYYTFTNDGDFLWPFIASIGINYTFHLIPEEKHHH
jgi:hypothetical protein